MEQNPKQERSLPFILAIVAFALVFYFLAIHGKLHGQGDVDVYLNYGTIIQQTFSEYKSIPLWQHTLSGGFPLYAFPEVPQFEIAHILYSFVPNSIAALNLSILLYLIIAGIGMFLFVYELERKKSSAIIASLAYMFTGNMLVSIFTLPFFYPTTLIPIIFFFLLKAFRSEQIKDSLFFASLVGLAWSIQILSGGSIIFLWTAFGVGLFSLYYFILKIKAGQKKALLKTFFLVSMAVVFFTVLFSAIKLLPSTEIKELSQRNAKAPTYEEFVWEHTQIEGGQAFSSIIFKNDSRIYLGPIIAILCLLSLPNIRKPHVLFFWILAILTLAIEFGTPLTRLIYNVPVMNETRQIYNVLALFGLAVAVLSASGLITLTRIRMPDKIRAAIVAVIAIAILTMAVQGFARNSHVTVDQYELELEQNSMLQAIRMDKDIFRIHQPAENFVGASIARYSVPLGLQTSEWTTTNLWFPEYVTFNQIAGANLGQTAKWWGMQNVKYVTSPVIIDEQRVPGLKLNQTFQPCTICQQQLTALYFNERFLPRAYFVNTSILVVDSDIMWVTYDIMLQDYFEPSRAFIEIDDSKLARISLEELDRHSAVLVADRQLPREKELMLDEFERKNRTVARNFLTQEWVDFKTRQAGDVKKFLEKKGPLTADLSYIFEELPENSATEVQLTMAPTKVTAQIDNLNHPRFLVFSDRFSRFEGWKAEFNGKRLPITNANVVASMIEIPQGETGTLTLEYKPKRFLIGLGLTALAFVLLAVILFYRFRKNSLIHQKA